MSRPSSLPTWEQIHACPGPTPSYHELPPQVPRRVGSQRSYADSLVLNDNLVSQTIGSEDFSFNVRDIGGVTSKHMRRNQYEDALSAVQVAAIRRVYAHNGADLEVIKVLMVTCFECSYYS